MDYTFSTNSRNFVLGCIGPCGLRANAKTQLPCVQLVPIIFYVRRSEDRRAHTLLLQLYECWRAQTVGARALTDGFLDHSCLASAASYFGEKREIYLHRC